MGTYDDIKNMFEQPRETHFKYVSHSADNEANKGMILIDSNSLQLINGLKFYLHENAWIKAM